MEFVPETTHAIALFGTLAMTVAVGVLFPRHDDKTTNKEQVPRKQHNTRRKQVTTCPFSAESSFCAAEPPPSMDPWEHVVDPNNPHLGLTWLAAGSSGQDQAGFVRAQLRYIGPNGHFLIPDNKYMASDLDRKEKVLASFRDVRSVMEPSSLDAQQEVLELFTSYLPTRHADKYSYDPNSNSMTIHATNQTHCLDYWNDRPLELCARMVQEDLVLMRPSAEDETCCMAAATVVFSFNDVSQKLGTNTHFIHKPVPGYEKHLSKAVYRSLKSLKPEKPMWRNNWFMVSSDSMVDENNELNKEESQHDDIGNRFFIKVEYQTIRRLPKTGYLLFTIRNFTHPMASLKHVPPKAARTLAVSIRGMSPALLKYKGIESDKVRDDMLAYLDSIAQGQ